jgi:hypothetical protein
VFFIVPTIFRRFNHAKAHNSTSRVATNIEQFGIDGATSSRHYELEISYFSHPESLDIVASEITLLISGTARTMSEVAYEVEGYLCWYLCQGPP